MNYREIVRKAKALENDINDVRITIEKMHPSTLLDEGNYRTNDYNQKKAVRDFTELSADVRLDQRYSVKLLIENYDKLVATQKEFLDKEVTYE